MFCLHGALMCFWLQITLWWQFHTRGDSRQAWVWAAAAHRGRRVIKAFFLLPPPALQLLPPSPRKKKTQANIIKVSRVSSSAAKQIASRRRWRHKQTESPRRRGVTPGVELWPRHNKATLMHPESPYLPLGPKRLFFRLLRQPWEYFSTTGSGQLPHCF